MACTASCCYTASPHLGRNCWFLPDGARTSLPVTIFTPINRSYIVVAIVVGVDLCVTRVVIVVRVPPHSFRHCRKHSCESPPYRELDRRLNQGCWDRDFQESPRIFLARRNRRHRRHHQSHRWYPRLHRRPHPRQIFGVTSAGGTWYSVTLQLLHWNQPPVAVPGSTR